MNTRGRPVNTKTQLSWQNAMVNPAHRPRRCATTRSKEIGYYSHRPPMTFETFYQQQYRSVLGLAYVLVGEQDGAEDLTQEAFTKAHQKWDEIESYENPQAWVRRVLVNQKVSAFRRLDSERKAKTKLRLQRPPVIELSSRSEEIWASVRALPERQAQTIALRYWNDLTINQIAETLDCGAETVKTHLSRARATLAKNLTNQADGTETLFDDPPGSERRKP